MKITLTENAKKRISAVCKDGEFIRISLIGGGCHGFSYKFGIDSNLEDDDFKIEENGKIEVAMKNAFVEKLHNSIVDFITNITSSYFVLKSENFGTTCGCGTSFSLKEI